MEVGSVEEFFFWGVGGDIWERGGQFLERGSVFLEIAIINFTSRLLFGLLYTCWVKVFASLVIFHLMLLAYFVLLKVFLIVYYFMIAFLREKVYKFKGGLS